MDAPERDEITMASAPYLPSDDCANSTTRVFSTRNRSASMSIPMNSQDSSGNEHNSTVRPLRNERRAYSVQLSTISRYPSIDRVEENNDWRMDVHVGKNEHLLRTGKLGMCNDPYCTKCPTHYNVKRRQRHSRTSDILDAKFHNILFRDAKGWAKRIRSFLLMCIPGVMNPHAKVVQQWNTFFVISCLFAAFLDPLFFFLLSVHQNNKCIVLSWPMTITFVILRSMTDFIYLLHILLQFRLAYVNSKSGVIAAVDLVDDPRMIARNYFFGYFGIDFFVVLPLPQIIISLILVDSVGASGANYARDLLQAAILAQYIPRLYRFLPLIGGSSPTGFIFESLWSNFVIYLLTIVLTSHVVGSCWYLFGLQQPAYDILVSTQSFEI
ncbi:hypothetical protein BUALT_Bualt16G0079200 [Buddleja alternifolia]|uniref:Ion transport domain-containing protein n=1 Tax=Buddleja alternifolia TaxID=168488 RepID=A0AAV6WKS1_9LAMI|nr:hypothetical protein BUALT_Bualt16G0079200 [Buddleja alternifolia]